MSQNLISLSYTAAELASMSESLAVLEAKFSGLIALSTEQRRSLARMGAKSEQFCRQTLMLAGQNPDLIPKRVSVADAQADLLALDQLRPLFARLVRLGEHAADTETALGSDVMKASLQCYKLLKDVGQNLGLETLRKMVGARFAKAPRNAETHAV